ncbi:MAG: response regulator [Candidatus Schekmanbacteria bacterium]|nr:response regulator [Candidatus Schekmanbacteria bacterium]
MTARILVVEDNPTSLAVARLALEAEGHRVFAAPDGAVALAYMEREAPDLVLMDLLLPDTDGVTLSRRLRAMTGGRNLPIIAFSGFLGSLWGAAELDDVFTAFLVKPIEPSELVERVQSLLPPSREGATPAGSSHRLLLVDDDPTQLKLLAMRLRGLGFAVTTATDGAAALAAARVDLPDAIVCDVLMPVLDGFGLAMEARRDPRLAAIPIVLLTSSYIEESDRELARRAGADQFAIRTPDLEDAIAALREALRCPRPPVPAGSPERLQMDHARSVARQLDRQLARTTELARRTALQAAQLTLFRAVHEGLQTAGDIRPALQSVLGTCLDAAGLSRGALFLMAPDGRIELSYAESFGPDAAVGLEQLFGHPEVLRQAVESGDVLAIPSTVMAEGVTDELLARLGARSALLVSLTWAEERLGALLLGSQSEELLNPESVEFARTLGSQCAQAVQLMSLFTRLMRSEERYRRIVESTREGVWMIDAEDRVAFANRRMGELLGVPPNELVGRPVLDFTWPEDSESFRENLDQLRRGISQAREQKLRCPDGATLHVRLAADPIRDERGHYVGGLALVSDLTELKNAHAQLMASDRMASIGMLAAGVGHEINNPLTAVIGFLQLANTKVTSMLRDGGPYADLERIRDDLGEALAGGLRVAQIVRDLKIFSRHHEEPPGPVDIHAVLDSSLRMAWNEIRHRARLHKEYGDVPPVLGNESRLGQVFLNLVVNAFQAIPEGRADENEIRVRTAHDGSERVRVEVADTGCGIPPQILDRLFTPFVTTKPAGMGTGLGLSICQRIVSDLGGEIRVESRVGHGTVFRVFLPVAPGILEAAPEELAEAAVPPRRGRILVIDDEDAIGGMVRKALGGEHDVQTAATGAVALERIAAGERFDVILCDLMMPVMTGTDFYAALRRIAPAQLDRLVFMTGGVFTPQARAFIERLPAPVLEKPFDVVRLCDLVAERLRR